MTEIAEIKVGNSVGYLVKDKTTGTERIVCNTFAIKKIGDETVIIFKDSNQKIIQDFNDYLNRPTITEMTPAYIKHTCFNLKLFANFLDIYDLKAEDMAEEKNLSTFVSFLIGSAPIINSTTRTNETCNNALISVRSFLNWKKIDSPINNMNRANSGFKYSLSEKSKKTNQIMYIDKTDLSNLNEIVSHATPCYTTRFIETKKKLDAKYQRKIKQLEKKGDISNLPKPTPLPDFDEQGYVIFRLAGARGLRLGEILGLTCEDVKIIKGAKGSIRKGVYLRNRLSDCDYQYSKELMHPRTPADYKSKEYNKSGIGYSFVDIDDVTWKLIQNIINRDLPVYDKAYPDKAEEVKADCVSGAGTNSYIFRSSYGGRLSDQVWNKRLRSYFITAGLPVDTGKKEGNLTHRLRHSFAMLLVKDGNLSPVFLASVLRHKNINTVQAYYTPTHDDSRDVYEAIEKEMMNPVFTFSDDDDDKL